MAQAQASGSKPSYSTLKANYSRGGCKCYFGNNCAINMSKALIACDSDWKDVFKNSGKNICACGYIRGAQDLASVIEKEWRSRDKGFANPGSRPQSMEGEEGLIVYMNIKGFGGQGHIDLFPDGTEYWNCETVWFWKL